MVQGDLSAAVGHGATAALQPGIDTRATTLVKEQRHFIGVDLAWHADDRHSGIAVLVERHGTLDVPFVGGAVGVQATADLVRQYAATNTVTAIDAPLVIRNVTGQRPCETEVGRRFGRYGASCHSSNLTLFPDPASLRFVKALEAYGFTQWADIADAPHREGRWLFEVYPHPAHVVLFELDRILRYKKGRIEDRRIGLRTYASHMMRLVALLCGNLGDQLRNALEVHIENVSGPQLKEHEDRLDAIFCALLAYLVWVRGADGFEVVGDMDTGYIVIPTRECARLRPGVDQQ